MDNETIKKLINESEIKKFELAGELNTSSTYLPTILRKKLTTADKIKILTALRTVLQRHLHRLNETMDYVNKDIEKMNQNN